MKRPNRIDSTQRSLRIGVLLQSDFPPDVRLSKEMGTWREDGHRIGLVCNNRNNRPRTETDGKLTIHRIPCPFPSFQRINKLVTSPFVCNPLWILEIVRAFRRGTIDVLHVINLPLAPLAILMGKMLRVPVVYDMYENYPEAIRSWRLKGFKSILRNPRVAEIIDDFCMKKADFLIVVVQEAMDRLIAKNVDQKKITVVENTVDFIRFKSLALRSDILKKYTRTYTIVYTGQFSVERGIETAIRAMVDLKGKIRNVKLVLVGSGPNKKDLEKMVKMLKINDMVEFTGWVDYQLFPSFIRAADVCIIPQPSNPFIDTTMPNKIYEYMAMGKPILTSDAKPMLRLIRKCRCGETFESNSVRDFADQIFRIRGSGIPYGRNGLKAVEKKYNWARSSVALRLVYQDIRRWMECDHPNSRP